LFIGTTCSPSGSVRRPCLPAGRFLYGTPAWKGWGSFVYWNDVFVPLDSIGGSCLTAGRFASPVRPSASGFYGTPILYHLCFYDRNFKLSQAEKNDCWKRKKYWRL
jgi:hypothetical protein